MLDSDHHLSPKIPRPTHLSRKQFISPLCILSQTSRELSFLSFPYVPWHPKSIHILHISLLLLPWSSNGKESACKVQSLGWEVPLEKGMAIHSSILAQRIPRTEKPVGSQRINHDWVTNTTHLGLIHCHLSSITWATTEHYKVQV